MCRIQLISVDLQSDDEYGIEDSFVFHKSVERLDREEL